VSIQLPSTDVLYLNSVRLPHGLRRVQNFTAGTLGPWVRLLRGASLCPQLSCLL